MCTENFLNSHLESDLDTGPHEAGEAEGAEQEPTEGPLHPEGGRDPRLQQEGGEVMHPVGQGGRETLGGEVVLECREVQPGGAARLHFYGSTHQHQLEKEKSDEPHDG
jgi:hypothetical protein